MWHAVKLCYTARRYPHRIFSFLANLDFDSKMSCPFWQDIFVATVWLRLWDELAVGREMRHVTRKGAAKQWIHHKGRSGTGPK